MNNKMHSIVMLLGLVVLVIVVGYAFGIPALRVPNAASDEKKIQQLDRWLDRLYSNGKFYGVVLLSRGEQVIFAKGYGYADIHKREALSPHSSFNLASVSKQFTAVGIILLKHQGKLSYSDELRELIPELSFYSGITIRHLLNHTSGIPEYFRIANDSIEESETVTAEKLIKVYSERKPSVGFKPGDKFEYSNMGYVLLAEIIERISGKSYAAYMYENIFRPLGMKHTKVFTLLSEEEPENRVFGFKRQYFLFGKLKQADLNRFDGVAGDGGIYSCVHDLFIWHRALLAGAIVPVELLAEAYHSGVLNDGSETGYGLGWFINSDGTVGHAGGWQGFATYLHRDLDQDQLIVVLDNTGNLLRVTSNGVRYNSIPLNLQSFMDRF